jgi:prepilin-type N-terminal cleavage/methylation domain-containing protein
MAAKESMQILGTGKMIRCCKKRSLVGLSGKTKAAEDCAHSKTWRMFVRPNSSRSVLESAQSPAALARRNYLSDPIRHTQIRPTSGFTLTELLVVCLIIGIMAALVVAEMRSSFEDALLRSSGRRLIDVCGLTYSRAVSSSQIHRVRLDKYSGQYLIEKQVGDGQEDSDFEPATDIPAFKGQFDQRVLIDLQRPEPDSIEESDLEPRPLANDGITFYPDGTADACQILLRDRMGYEMTLQINPTTGRVHVMEKDEAASK